MLNKVKLALRINKNNFDEELNDLIEEAKLDLITTGVIVIDDKDHLIQKAIKTYCKANFGLDNKDSEKYQDSYESIKNKLALCGDYNE